jgi:hypothetical protein
MRGSNITRGRDPSPVSHLRCEPPSPTRGEGKSAHHFGADDENGFFTDVE